MTDEQTLIRLIDHPDKPVTFSFEDDGKTGYAYLIDSDTQKIVADVWLYNRQPTPSAPEWTTRDGAPFRNSAAYVDSEVEFEPPTAENDIDVHWIEDEKARVGSIVLLRNEPIAELYVGDMPGKSKLARIDGPVARKFDRHKN